MPTYAVATTGLTDHSPSRCSREIGPRAAILGARQHYARLFVGWRTAIHTFGVSQLLYLVLFSFTFFFEGFTGLAITVGAILTLFVMMQLTGRLDWAEVLGRPAGSGS